MLLSWSKEQLRFRERVASFARENLAALTEDQAADPSNFKDRWAKCAQFGLQGMPVPKEFGGSGRDLMTSLLGMEAIGYGSDDNGLVLGLNAHMWTVALPLVSFASDEIKKRVLPGMSDGSLIGAHALTEDTAGSDAFAMKTHAKPVKGGYKLNGTKSLVTLGPVADLFFVFATTRPDRGMWGVTALLVESDREGITVGEPIGKMGMRSVPLSRVTFQDCFVPESNRVGPEGAGGRILTKVLEWDHTFLLGSHVGAIERVLENTIAFAKDRSQFGQPISKFQSVSHRIADIKVRLETARWVVYRAAWLLDQGESAALESAIAKLVVSESFLEATIDSVRTYGGRGYLTEYGVEQQIRDAVGGLLYAGTSDIQRNLVARLMGL